VSFHHLVRDGASHFIQSLSRVGAKRCALVQNRALSVAALKRPVAKWPHCTFERRSDPALLGIVPSRLNPAGTVHSLPCHEIPVLFYPAVVPKRWMAGPRPMRLERVCSVEG